MKTMLYPFLTVLLALLAFAPNTFAQDNAQLGLPEGAKARLGKGWIGEIAYSPDGTRLAVASGIGIWHYDAQSGEELDLLTGHTSWDESLVFSPDGNIFASADGKVIHLWDARTGTHLQAFIGHTDFIGSIAFSPDGNTIASASYGTIPSAFGTHAREHNFRTFIGHTVPVFKALHSVPMEIPSLAGGKL